jgi:hypothetical protein
MRLILVETVESAELDEAGFDSRLPGELPRRGLRRAIYLAS